MTELIAKVTQKDSLPHGWTTGTIEDLVAANGVFSDGDWVESKDQDPGGDVRLIQLADVGDGYYRNRSSRFLTSDKAQQLSCTFLHAGDLLIARMPDPLGRACIFPGDHRKSVTVVDVCVVRAGTADIDPRWLMHFINSPAFRMEVAALQSGSTRKRISRKNLSKIELPVPPSREQRRIVEKIEELFTKLDAGVRSLEQVREQLKTYRRSVLKTAVEGELSREWREAHRDALEPASELLERILQERREKFAGKKYKEQALPSTGDPSVPDSWTHTFLAPLVPATKDSVKTGPFGSLLKKHEHRTDGVPVFGIENVRNMTFVAGSKIHVTQEKAVELSGYDAQPGDVLISRSGTVGQVCVVPEDIGIARISTNLIRVRLLPNGMHPAFFTLLFNGSPYVLDQVSELCKGSTRDFLNQSILASLIFPLPPLEEQRFIVEEVERRLSVVDKLEATVEANLKQADALRQSILKHAFSGELVPQDPNDEPASVLLERIRQERQAARPKARRGRTGKTGTTKRPHAEQGGLF